MFKNEIDDFYENQIKQIEDAIKNEDKDKLFLLSEWDEYSLYGFK